jgi:MOSC domain-containing protein YiiM
MKIIAVNCDAAHRFSKPTRPGIRLIAGHGVEGDAHAGPLIKHRYQARQTPQMKNNRQIHLIPSELFETVRAFGFEIKPGELGENVTTQGLDLGTLPLGTQLRLGCDAVVELTGLRIPCGYIDRFQKGLKRLMIVRTLQGVTFRAGVMGVVRAGGVVAPNDPVAVELPSEIRPLPAI